MEELVGHTLGHGEYRLVAQLGAGGMGAVYEADQASLRRRVAVKVLWPHLAHQPGLVGRFNREARIAARLDHPHILPIYAFGVEGDLMYLVMRLIRGGSLMDRLRGEGPRRKGWSPHEVLELAEQALPPLDYAHRQGVIHRDLKPDNILLEPSDDFPCGYRVFLGDFGIARLAHGDDVELGLTQTGASPGTPAYMAPEQVLDQDLDGRADLYAFGIILYELLVGRVPFRGQTPVSVALQHVQEPVPAPHALNSALTGALEEVLLRSLAKDRDQRFPSGAALIAALTDAVRSSDVESTARSSSTATDPPFAARSSHAEARAKRMRPEGVEEPPGRTPSPPITPRRTARRAVDAGPTRSRGGLLMLLLCAVTVAASLLTVSSLVLRNPSLDLPFAPSIPIPAVPEATTSAPTALPSQLTQQSQPVPPDPRAWVVSPSELGADWTVRRESARGSTPLLSVYEVDYAPPDDTTSPQVGFSLYSALSTSSADAGMQQLRQSAEASGVVFEAFPLLIADQPSLRGRASLAAATPSVSVVQLFRIDRVVAVVEVVGRPDQEVSIAVTAEHAAELQRDRLLGVRTP